MGKAKLVVSLMNIRHQAHHRLTFYIKCKYSVAGSDLGNSVCSVLLPLLDPSRFLSEVNGCITHNLFVRKAPWNHIQSASRGVYISSCLLSNLHFRKNCRHSAWKHGVRWGSARNRGGSIELTMGGCYEEQCSLLELDN